VVLRFGSPSGVIRGRAPLCSINKQLRLTRRLGRKRVEEGEISREDIPRKVGEAEKGMEMDVSPRPLCFFLSFARWFGRQSCLLEKAKKKKGSR
jgi:hypothetical protein